MTSIEWLYGKWTTMLPLRAKDLRRLENKFRMDYNFHSNHIGGNQLTFEQTKLLFMLGETSGNASMQDYEAMKSHDAALALVKKKVAAGEPFSESLISELYKTLFMNKFSKDDTSLSVPDSSIEPESDMYRTSPGTFTIPTGEVYNYAAPEEVPEMMHQLVEWYLAEEKKAELSTVELIALFYYRFARIHPFEDGNGRIVRLLVNYILHSHQYPMIVILASEKNLYFRALNQCDIAVGNMVGAGMDVRIDYIRPLEAFIEKHVKYALEMGIKAGKGESIEEPDEFAKKVSGLKQELASEDLGVAQIQYSPEAVRTVINHSIAPLLLTWEGKVKLLDSLFADRQIAVKTDAKKVRYCGYDFESLIHNADTIDEFSRSLKISISLSVEGIGKVDNHLTINGGGLVIDFYKNVYKITTSTGTVTNKLYHQMLKKDELNYIADELSDQLVENIEQIRKVYGSSL
ncbi:MAG: Fic family protein [Tannerella sp.]|jgi:Fic family protein|nr:Fic family protein [Tannerella sp.]